MSLGRALLIVVLPCSLLTAAAIAFAAAGQQSAEGKRLLRERRDTLQQIADIQAKAYQSGTVRIDSVLAAQKDLCEADLELAEQRSQRIEICERLVKTMESMEAVSQRLHIAGETVLVDVLSTKAARLKAQAQLANERQADN